MSTQIGELIFNSGKTLFEILDALDVPQVANQLDAVTSRLDEVNDQLRQLGAIVDSNQANTTASFISVNTQLDALVAEVTALNLAVAPLSIQIVELQREIVTLGDEIITIDTTVSNLQDQINVLVGQISDVRTLVNGYNSRISFLESNLSTLQQQVTTLTSRVQLMELTSGFNQQLRLGNEYICTFRSGGVPGTTYYYRINYSGSTSTVILAARGYPATVFSSIEGTTTSRTVYLCAPFDLFSANGRYNYSMIQGPCRISFSVNNTNPAEGYITLI